MLNTKNVEKFKATIITENKFEKFVIYNEDMNPLYESDSSKSEKFWKYDNKGNLIYFKNLIIKTYYEYDIEGRLIREESTNGIYTDYEYDIEGRLISEKSPYAQTYYEYDIDGRLIRKNRPDNFYTDYKYDSNGKLISEKWSNKLFYTDYKYDKEGRLNKSESERSMTLYDDQGNAIYVWDKINKEEKFYIYDNEGRMISCRRKDVLDKEYTTTIEWSEV